MQQNNCKFVKSKASGTNSYWQWASIGIAIHHSAAGIRVQCKQISLGLPTKGLSMQLGFPERSHIPQWPQYHKDSWVFTSPVNTRYPLMLQVGGLLPQLIICYQITIPVQYNNNNNNNNNNISLWKLMLCISHNMLYGVSVCLLTVKSKVWISDKVASGVIQNPQESSKMTILDDSWGNFIWYSYFQFYS